MTIIERFAEVLANAHRTGQPATLDAELDGLAVDDAPAVQLAVMRQLGETALASKVAINKTGRAVAAPMLGSRFVTSGGTLPAAGLIGFEVEIAVRLGRDLTPELAARGESGLMSAIDAFFVGIECIGPHIANHREAGLGALLADNLVSGGYVLNTESPWRGGSDIAGAVVTAHVDGIQVHSAAASNPFGGVLVALHAYAQAPFDGHGVCSAGHIITTGTLCGLIPVTGPCRIVAGIDATQVEVTLR